jgi:hypothetical protein
MDVAAKVSVSSGCARAQASLRRCAGWLCVVAVGGAIAAGCGGENKCGGHPVPVGFKKTETFAVVYPDGAIPNELVTSGPNAGQQRCPTIDEVTMSLGWVDSHSDYVSGGPTDMGAWCEYQIVIVRCF